MTSTAAPTDTPHPDASADRPTRADALVVFGLTGDLGRSELLPALWELHATERLGIPVVGVGRDHPGDDRLRSMLRDCLPDDDAARLGVDAAGQVDEIDLRFVAGDVADATTWSDLADELDGCERVVVYAALPPDLLAQVAERMSASDLAAARLVVEKPFGHDADSARELHREIDRHIGAERLFIVDHFLAKASVELMTTTRWGNPILAAALRAPHVAEVRVDFPEAGGVDGRGSFYDSVGVVADVVQNHLLQTLTLALMDPPADDGAAALSDVRRELLGSIRPLRPDEVVLGRYEGYRDVEDVPADSDTATAFVGRFHVDHPAWTGVPVIVRTGKRLPATGFHVSFRIRLPGSEAINVVRFVHGDEPRIELDLNAPGDDAGGIDRPADGERSVTTEIDLPAGHGPLRAYATMLDSALAGDRRHFADVDEVVEAWRIVEPIEGPRRPAVRTYAPDGDTFPSHP